MIIINPGTGPVAGAHIDRAYENMAALLVDAKLPDATFARDAEAVEDDGRFAFVVTLADKRVEVLMPGIALKRVRYTGARRQNIWDFPRLYVDGDSWVWMYAVNRLRERLAEAQP